MRRSITNRTLREASSSFDRGNLALERLLVAEGLRCANESFTASKNSYHDYGNPLQRKIQAVEQGIVSCRASCEDLEKQCLASTVEGDLATLFVTGCRLRSAECQLTCNRPLIEVISSLESEPRSCYGDKRPGLEQEIQNAAATQLINNAEIANHSVEEGARHLKNKVAFDEFLRVTLKNYKEYGVSEGVTELMSGSRQSESCHQTVASEHEECKLGNAQSYVDGQQGAIATVAGHAGCNLITNLRTFDCGVQTVKRLLGNLFDL